MISLNIRQHFGFTSFIGGHWRGTVGLLSAFALGLPALRSADAHAKVPANEPVLVLPPMMVESTGFPLRWRYLELPGSEVLSVCDDDVTLKFAERCLRLEFLLRQVLPARFQAKSDVPEKLIVFNEKLNRARSQEVMEEMMRRAGGKMPRPERRSISSWLESDSGWPGGKPTLQLLPNLVLRDADTTIVFTSLVNSTENPMDFTYQVDRIVELLTRRSPVLPSWFLAGMIGLYQQTQLRGDHVEFGKALWSSEEETRALATEPDRPRTLLPMRELLATRHFVKSNPPGEMDLVWQAQCTLFLRWAIAENSAGRREALWNLIDRLSVEPLSERLFQDCFGLGYSDVRDRLSDYLPVAVTRGKIMPVEKFPPLPAMKIRAATETEVARIVGDWERLEIGFVRKTLPALTENYIEQARHRVERLYLYGNEDRDLLAVKGLIEIEAGNRSAAESALELAAASGVIRPRVYFELASLRHQKALAESAGEKLNAAQTARVLQPLFQADQQEPALPEIYALMAEVWSHSVQSPSHDELMRLNAGIHRFPHASALVLMGIYFNLNAGLTKSALELATEGALHAKDPEMRHRFSEALNELKSGAPLSNDPAHFPSSLP